MEKSKLYTGGGDAGHTSLVGGERESKGCLRLETYGTVDEFSAFLGLLACWTQMSHSEKEFIKKLQHTLFDIGGYLATSPDGQGIHKVDDLGERIREVEHRIDLLDMETPKIHAFVLCGGCEGAARAHVARTVCRRVERSLVRLAGIEEVDGEVLKYFNRLSDYLFILARNLNFQAGVEELTWQP